MAPYLTIDEFKLETTMANSAVDEVEDVVAPGFVTRKLTTVSALVDARLSKRYSVPFASPFPLAIVRWVTDIVTREVYLKRGVDPNDAAWTIIESAAERAEKELTEAADGAAGLFELPATQGGADGVSKGGPRSKTSASPYVWMDEQRRQGRAEDRNREGTRRG
jgi:hypothetical protein